MSDPLKPMVEVERQEDGSARIMVAESSQEVLATPLTGFLQVKDPSPEEQRQLKEIWDYIAEESPSELTSERLYTLRHIEQRLATPRLGQTRIQQLHQYITVDRQAKSIGKLRDTMLR